ncbi:TonB-dependent receptor [Epilithonimonas ginsengisoli]|uniref:TonB-dependent receptor n=1 Tax=Epilithonimonas ginsengisoli TaxID=1245592 RepID=A0ABU4JJ74_9FLAO|nr:MULTISPECIES: TonB-dependent receptor [Chryseobacterium group]MBV6880276.1 TonB-dependent receptor [Epilithonimonas sp. FP105]MDW8549728.1 TonB-dependent receptor [Epilithonimonas ginsengisoli]OAH72190.1 SusC/RagA family TonB-linked outer membrane protein [Chryseobacterium sp. FP211-J200]
MNLKYSKCLGLAAVLYFTANYSAQQRVSDTTSKEKVIEEVVVIGYGTQKKSNVTGAIASIKASDIENIPAGKPEQVLQGRAAGVSVVTNSGQPGAAATVRVRGITSFGAGSNSPLWVVDGIVVDNIGWLNQSDIESIEVLKDGASSAIYGVSAAKGVILVTTKKGKKGKLGLSYNGFYGFGNAAKKLDLLNATEYATIINEAFSNDGKPIRYADPSKFGKGTDWQDTIFGTGEKSNHEVSINGGNEKSTYYASFGYFDQTGIVMSDISYYKRLNARLNSTHKVTDWLTVGQTFAYTHTKSQGISANEEYGGPLASAVNLDPTTPVVVKDWSMVDPSGYTNQYIIRDPNGNPYGISQYVNQEMTNPRAFRYIQQGNYSWSDDLVANVFAELKLHKSLTFKTSLNGKKSYWGSRSFMPKYYLSPNYSNTGFNSLNKVDENKFEWSMENTLNYQNRFGDHNLNVLVGQGVYRYNISGGTSLTYTNLPIDNWQDASFNFNIPQDDITATGWDGIQTRKASYFGRIIYDYADKYLFTGTIRRDGSSKFATKEHWGTFPSMSIGWNVNKENFWPENKVVNNLKLRGGYGVLGNDEMENFRFASFMVSGSNYTNAGNNIIIGYAPSTMENPNLKWEETSQLNIAADLKLFNNFTLTADWYKKKTTDILRQINIPGYVGVPNLPWSNVGDMENSGLELELGYKKNWNDFGISVNGNFATIKNKVLRLEDDIDYFNLASFQTMGAVSRVQVGQPYGSFYGYTYSGVFQNQAQVDSYVNSNGEKLLSSAKPGDFIWQDSNGDGKIDDNDKVNLGSSIPKYTFGLTVNLNYKNFDFMAFAQGQAGNKIFQGLRRLDMLDANYQTKILDRWTGEGSTNDNPRVTRDDSNHNYSWMSNYYLQKGDYVRLKIIQLGYTIPQDVTTRFGMSKVRLYITGENVFTFTKYTGYDPEIAGRNNSEQDIIGVDRAYYPQARTFLIGANIQF